MLRYQIEYSRSCAEKLAGTNNRRSSTTHRAFGDSAPAMAAIEREKIRAATFTAIGALRDAILLYFNWEKKD
jgi:hypothetical protein